MAEVHASISTARVRAPAGRCLLRLVAIDIIGVGTFVHIIVTALPFSAQISCYQCHWGWNICTCSRDSTLRGWNIRRSVPPAAGSGSCIASGLGARPGQRGGEVWLSRIYHNMLYNIIKYITLVR